MIDLLPLALQALESEDAAAVLGDAILEAGWSHPWLMLLVLGMDLDPLIPSFGSSKAREIWKRIRARDLTRARLAEENYRGTRQWARAVAAVLLFGEWRRRVPFRDGTRTPWPMIRRAQRSRFLESWQQNPWQDAWANGNIRVRIGDQDITSGVEGIVYMPRKP